MEGDNLKYCLNFLFFNEYYFRLLLNLYGLVEINNQNSKTNTSPQKKLL